MGASSVILMCSLQSLVALLWELPTPNMLYHKLTSTLQPPLCLQKVSSTSTCYVVAYCLMLQECCCDFLSDNLLLQTDTLILRTCDSRYAVPQAYANLAAAIVSTEGQLPFYALL